VIVDAPDFDCAILRSIKNFKENGCDVDKNPIVFLGYVA
jgi:hypothetical protein